MNTETIICYGKDGEETMVGYEEWDDDEIEGESLSTLVNLEEAIFVCGHCGEHCNIQLDGDRIIVKCFGCHP